jgi:hypothetical protein
VEVIIKASGQGCPDSRHLLEVGHARAHHTLESSEVLEQLATLRGTQAGHDLQDRFVVAASTLAPMAGDSEAVRLVPNALNQARRG